MGNRYSKQAGLARAAICLAFTLATAVACGPDEGDSGDGNSDGNSGGDTTSNGTGSTASSSIESLDDMLHAITAGLCSSECEQISLIPYVYGENCLETYTLLYEALGASIRPALDAGSVSFDAVEAQRCVDAFNAKGCNYDTEYACEKVFIGNVPAGGACTQSAECAGGGYCNDTLACPGVCEATLAAGAACANASEACESGLICLPETGVCGERKANGEPCVSPVECETRYCEDTDGTGQCAEDPGYFVKALGEPCEGSFECAENLYCPATESGPTCTAAVNLGEPCEAVSFVDPCVRGAYCDAPSGSTGVCIERVPLGEACTDTKECAIGVCDGGVCEKHSGLGGPCVTDERCFGVCDDGTCAAEPACPVE